MQFLPSKRVKWLISKLCFVPSLGQHCKISITVPEEQTSSWLSFHNCLTDHDKKKKKGFINLLAQYGHFSSSSHTRGKRKKRKSTTSLKEMKTQWKSRCCTDAAGIGNRSHTRETKRNGMVPVAILLLMPLVTLIWTTEERQTSSQLVWLFLGELGVQYVLWIYT